MSGIRTVVAVALIGLVVPLLAGSDVRADVTESAQSPRNQFTLRAGYFINVHSHFFPLFQSRIAFGASFNHDFRSKYGYEVTAGYKQARDKSRENDLLSVSSAVLVTRTMYKSQFYHWRIGAGPGMGYRDYSAEAGLLSTSRYHQREFSLTVQAETSFDCLIGPAVIKGVAAYERHLTGRASHGDFGDTGGFTFLGGLGLRF